MDTVYDYFKDQVISQPDALAILDEQRRVTFKELDQLIDTIAAGFTRESHFVGIVMDHSVEMIASILAVLKAGAAYVPVEPSFPSDRIKFIMKECQVDFILTNHEYAGKLKGLKLHFIERGIAIDGSKQVECKAKPESLAYVLYTSGSTGLPKGVMVENRNVCHYVRAFHNEFHPHSGDRMLQYSVCSFDIFVEEVFTTLLSGAALAIPSEETKSDIGKMMQFVEAHGVTEISGFPYLLLEMNKLPQIPKSLRLLISGGDVLRENYITKLLPHVEIYNTYGPSETTVCASYFRCNDQQALPDGTYPIGKAVLGAKMEIRDEQMNPVRYGQVGEICIFGDGVSRGYIGERKIENQAFVSLDDGQRMYRSGDLGIMQPDGNVLFLYRKDTQVMILGKRVEPCEVQNVLSQCDEVEKGVVRSEIDEQGLAYLTAYVVPKDHKRFYIQHVKRTMSKFLPSYMIPEFFVRLDSMPITPNGKVNGNALPIVMKGANL
jgi:D-alanine--poly(phosphoribitol) ligase subunit 1